MRPLATLGLALACTPAPPAPPDPPPPAPVAATPSPQPEPPAPRLTCPPLVTDDAADAERLRLFFSAVIDGDPLDAYLTDTTAGARLLAELRTRRACPTHYENNLLSFADPDFGAIDIDSFDDILNLADLEDSWLTRRAHAALRAHLAAHPDDLVSSTGPGKVSLILARHPDGATACVALADSDEADPRLVRCYRTDPPIRHAALLSHRDEDEPPLDRVRLGRAIFSVEPDGALRPARSAPRKYWSTVGAPDKTAEGPTSLALTEVPADSLPVAELRRISPHELAGDLPTVLTEDALCLRLDGTWRCADIHQSDDVDFPYGDPRPLAPVRQGAEITVPVEFEHCDGGSEVSECQTHLHLFRVDDRILRREGGLPIANDIDEHLRDRDDTGVTVQGARDDYQWRYRVETSRCVRFLELDAITTLYGGRYPDRGPPKNVVRRKKPLAVEFEPTPADLPRWPEFDPYPHPDLRGLWQLRGDRWHKVDRCDP